MIIRLLVFGSLLTALVNAEEIPRAIQITEPPSQLVIEGTDRVTSSTKQFLITGGPPQERANAAQLAEEAKDELLRLTEERDTWKIPITMILHGNFGEPMPPRTSAIQILVNESGYQLRLDTHLGRGIEHDRFKFATTAALIYERTLRNQLVQDSGIPFYVPPWLIDGLREATAWRLAQSDRRLYEALFKTGGLFKIDELFAVTASDFEEMDAAMRAAFRVSSGALVMALLQQPLGREGFRTFLNDVAAYQGEMPSLLRKHFPELNLSETSLSKWWALQLANIGGQNLATDILSISQTELLLTDSLRLHFRTQEGITMQKELSAWPEIAALTQAERTKSVQLAQDSLVRLSYRCFPSYRPILAEYQIALNAISKNKTANISNQLAALADRRATMSSKAERAGDYLDWFEITRAHETSGAFDDYMRLKERLKTNTHRRTDNLSKYLDQMDAVFSREGDLSPKSISPIPTNPAILGLPQP
jgi:hypothetical protein